MPSGVYTWLAMSTAISQLAQRLADPNFQFWSQAELQIYLTQALRQYNSLTFQWRVDFQFTPTNVWNSLGLLPGSPRQRTLYDTDAYIEMQYMLLEPPTGQTWTGTSQFSIADLSQALQRRRDEMIQVSNCNQFLLTGIPLTPNTIRTLLDDTVLDVPRVRYIIGSGVSGQGGLIQSNTYTDYANTSPATMNFTQPTQAGSLIIGFESNNEASGSNLSFASQDLTTIVSDDDWQLAYLALAPSSTTVSNFFQSAVQPDQMIAEFTGTFDTFDATTANVEIGDTATITTTNANGYQALAIATAKLYNGVEQGTLEPPTPTGWTPLLFHSDGSGFAAVFYQIVNGPSDLSFAWQGFSDTPPVGEISISTFNSSVPISSNGQGITLYRDDTIANEFYEPPLYQLSAGTPQTFSLSSEPPLSWDVDIPPDQAGSYEAIILKAGAPFNPPTPTLINVPNDFVWALEWGALADLLGRESEATDRERAAYAMKRYQDGLQLIQKAPWIELGKVDGAAVSIDSIYAADRYDPEWDSNPTGFGPMIVSGGVDFFGSPVGHGVGATVLGNAPILDSTSTYVQISRADADIMFDLAQSRASFKMGGGEWKAALELDQRAIQACAAENSRLRSMGSFSDILVQRGTEQERSMNRYNSKQK